MLIPEIGSRFCSIASIRSRARQPVRVRVRHRDKLDSVQHLALVRTLAFAVGTALQRVGPTRERLGNTPAKTSHLFWHAEEREENDDPWHEERLYTIVRCAGLPLHYLVLLCTGKSG